VVPGPSAVVSAVALSGFDGSRFAFEGFLPRKKKERKERLLGLASEERLVVLYEAPHRLAETLGELYDSLGNRNAALCKDMTKLFEKVERGTLAHLKEITAGQEPRGEYAIVVEGCRLLPAQEKGEVNEIPIIDALQFLLNQGMPRNEAVKRVAKEREITRREAYTATLGIGTRVE